MIFHKHAMSMEQLPKKDLRLWLDSGQVLLTDIRGPKVIALSDGSYLKIFHTRRHPQVAGLFRAAGLRPFATGRWLAKRWNSCSILIRTNCVDL